MNPIELLFYWIYKFVKFPDPTRYDALKVQADNWWKQQVHGTGKFSAIAKKTDAWGVQVALIVVAVFGTKFIANWLAQPFDMEEIPESEDEIQERADNDAFMRRNNLR